MRGRLLQTAVIVACLVPLLAGGAGVLEGLSMMRAPPGAPGLELHFRYLSGLLLGIGLAFLTCVPHIETKSQRFGTLAAVVVVGGLGRLVALMVFWPVPASSIAALVMELGVTPGLAFWQRRVSRRVVTANPLTYQ